jgi:hypothetical protein
LSVVVVRFRLGLGFFVVSHDRVMLLHQFCMRRWRSPLWSQAEEVYILM